MTNTVVDVAHKAAVGVGGFAVSKIASGFNEVIGLLIGVATLVYLVVKIRIALVELYAKRK